MPVETVQNTNLRHVAFVTFIGKVYINKALISVRDPFKRIHVYCSNATE